MLVLHRHVLRRVDHRRVLHHVHVRRLAQRVVAPRRHLDGPVGELEVVGPRVRRPLALLRLVDEGGGGGGGVVAVVPPRPTCPCLLQVRRLLSESTGKRALRHRRARVRVHLPVRLRDVEALHRVRVRRARRTPDPRRFVPRLLHRRRQVLPVERRQRVRVRHRLCTAGVLLCVVRVRLLLRALAAALLERAVALLLRTGRLAHGERGRGVHRRQQVDVHGARHRRPLRRRRRRELGGHLLALPRDVHLPLTTLPVRVDHVVVQPVVLPARRLALRVEEPPRGSHAGYGAGRAALALLACERGHHRPDERACTLLRLSRAQQCAVRTLQRRPRLQVRKRVRLIVGTVREQARNLRRRDGHLRGDGHRGLGGGAGGG
eukprot:Rhum_TRINITY_DN3607_c0_g1::Rhum_TRINITY_DN3607_c0_g1_i1::g.11429::m.11429